VIAPHDRRTPASAGQIDLPRDVLGGRPAVGQSRIVRRDAGLRAAELRPVLRAQRDGVGRRQDQKRRKRQAEGSSGASSIRKP
jgi:hypothetical protein